MYSKSELSGDGVITTLDRQAGPQQVAECIGNDGICIISNLFDPSFVEKLSGAVYHVQESIHRDIGEEPLIRAGEMGVLRTPMVYDDVFFEILKNPYILSLVDYIVSPNAILHLQNGFILPSFKYKEDTPEKFQNKLHMDFKRVLNGYLLSLNILVIVSDFSEENGGTLAIPGSHQMTEKPNIKCADSLLKAVEAPSGSLLVFDSTLWHCAGRNVSGQDRLGINHQFTYSYLKQQMDYVRVIGEEKLATLPERTKQLMGWYTRVPTSIDEYYTPADQRLYRANQD